MDWADARAKKIILDNINHFDGDVNFDKNLSAELRRIREDALEEAAKIADKLGLENDKFYEQLKSISSKPDELGVLKYAAYAGEDQRVATAIRKAIK